MPVFRPFQHKRFKDDRKVVSCRMLVVLHPERELGGNRVSPSLSLMLEDGNQRAVLRLNGADIGIILHSLGIEEPLEAA